METLLLFDVGAFILRCYDEKMELMFFFSPLQFMIINKLFLIILSLRLE